MCTCTVNWFCLLLYCKLVLCTFVLVLCTCVLQVGFVYMCFTNWFCAHVFCKLVLCTLVMKTGSGERQEYHTDGTLHMIGNVQYIQFNREFHKWLFHTNSTLGLDNNLAICYNLFYPCELSNLVFVWVIPLECEMSQQHNSHYEEERSTQEGALSLVN